MASSAPSWPENNNDSGGLSPLSLLQQQLSDGILATFGSNEGRSLSITAGSLMANGPVLDLGLMWSVAARKVSKSQQEPGKNKNEKWVKFSSRRRPIPVIGLSSSGCQGKIGGKNDEGLVLHDVTSARAADDSSKQRQHCMHNGEEGTSLVPVFIGGDEVVFTVISDLTRGLKECFSTT